MDFPQSPRGEPKQEVRPAPSIPKDLKDASATRYWPRLSTSNPRLPRPDWTAKLPQVRGGGELAVLTCLRCPPTHVLRPSVSQVGELLVQQHAGLMRRLQFRGWPAGGRGARLCRRSEAAGSSGPPPTTGTGRAAGGNGHVEVGLGVVEVHGPYSLIGFGGSSSGKNDGPRESTRDGRRPAGVGNGHQSGGNGFGNIHGNAADVVVAPVDVPPVLPLWVNQGE